MFRILSAVGAAALATVISMSGASAAPVYFCKDGPSIDLVNDGCISGTARLYPNGGDGIYSNSGGGDPEAAVETAIFGATGVAVDIALYGKSDDDPALFSNTGFPGTSGTWSTVAGDLIKYITVKAANSFSLFDVGNTSAGVWSTAGILNNGGEQPGVSHISFWTAGSTPPPSPVPLPAAGWMLIAALGGLGAMRRFRKS